MYRIELADDDLARTMQLVQEVIDRFGSVESPEFLKVASTYAQELPRSIRLQLNTFRLEESHGMCLLAGYSVDDTVIGPTPAHWDMGKDRVATRREEFFLVLISCLLGDPIAWATQQAGAVVHDILPIKEHEHEQLGSGSNELLTWHTEDAFHPLRADYLALMCLRNPDLVETTLACIDDIRLSEELISLLRRPSFEIRPDRSHLPENRSSNLAITSRERELIERSYVWIEQLDANPEKISVLFGGAHEPYVRIDPYFMTIPKDDIKAASALETLIKQIDSAVTGYSLRPGEVIILDNFKVVHGRKPFKAHFDGTDRWLKRLNISRDLRKSRFARLEPASRVIY